METRDYLQGVPTSPTTHLTGELCKSAIGVMNELEDRLKTLRIVRDEISGTIRDLEQRAADISGMLSKVPATSPYPQGVR